MPTAIRAFVAAVLVAMAPAAAAAQPVRSDDGSVSGRVVVEDTGAPVPAAEVRLQALSLPPDLAQRTTTDANGHFEFQRVEPREYRVTASKAGFFSTPRHLPLVMARNPITVRPGQAVTGIMVTLRSGGVIAGRVVDAHGEPVDRIRVYAERLEYASDGTRFPRLDVLSGPNDLTDDLGQFRLYELVPGDYLVVASGRPTGPPPPEINQFSWLTPGETVPTYYPGTADVAFAQIVSVGGGQVASAQIVLSDQMPVSVSGVVRHSDGSPGAGLEVMLNPTTGRTTIGRHGGKVAADGTFVLNGVPPGSYRVIVYPTPLPPRSESERRYHGETGAAHVTVGATDVRDVAIVTTGGATVTGTVVFERPYRNQPLQVWATPTDLRFGVEPVTSGPIGPDGAFTLSGVHDGARLAVRTAGWVLKSVLVDGQELGDAPLQLHGRTRVTGVRVTATDRIAGISGRALDDAQQPLGGHTVLVLRLDPTSETAPERLRWSTTPRDGAFSLSPLTPGSYVVGVVGEWDPQLAFEPGFQDRLRQYGRRFSLQEGDQLRFDLQPTKGL